MTNNQLCTLIGAVGCVIAFFGMGLVFFGVTPAAWAVCVGILMGYISVVSYD